jgi:hypothetical protein
MYLQELITNLLACQKQVTDYENNLFSGDNLRIMVYRLQITCNLITKYNNATKESYLLDHDTNIILAINKLTTDDIIAKVDPLYYVKWYIDYNTKSVCVSITINGGSKSTIGFPLEEKAFDKFVGEYIEATQKREKEAEENYKNTYQARRKELLKHIYEFQASYPDEMKGIREEM